MTLVITTSGSRRHLSNRAYLKVSIISLTRPLSLNRLKLWGTPGSQTSSAGAFYADLETQAMKFAKIPPDLDVSISHGPPFGRHDRVSLGHVGSSALANVVAARTPLYHVFGHITSLTEPAFQPAAPTTSSTPRCVTRITTRQPAPLHLTSTLGLSAAT